VKCAECQTENTPERRYCCACGRLLFVTCEACGFTNGTGTRFCGGCGQALQAMGPTLTATPLPILPSHDLTPEQRSLKGERKQLTVLFADLCPRWS
jgi:adenylate cyclase